MSIAVSLSITVGSATVAGSVSTDQMYMDAVGSPTNSELMTDAMFSLDDVPQTSSAGQHDQNPLVRPDLARVELVHDVGRKRRPSHVIDVLDQRIDDRDHLQEDSVDVDVFMKD